MHHIVTGLESVKRRRKTSSWESQSARLCHTLRLKRTLQAQTPQTSASHELPPESQPSVNSTVSETADLCKIEGPRPDLKSFLESQPRDEVSNVIVVSPWQSLRRETKEVEENWSSEMALMWHDHVDSAHEDSHAEKATSGMEASSSRGATTPELILELSSGSSDSSVHSADLDAGVFEVRLDQWLDQSLHEFSSGQCSTLVQPSIASDTDCDKSDATSVCGIPPGSVRRYTLRGSSNKRPRHTSSSRRIRQWLEEEGASRDSTMRFEKPRIDMPIRPSSYESYAEDYDGPTTYDPMQFRDMSFFESLSATQMNTIDYVFGIQDASDASYDKAPELISTRTENETVAPACAENLCALEDCFTEDLSLDDPWDLSSAPGLLSAERSHVLVEQEAAYSDLAQYAHHRTDEFHDSVESDFTSIELSKNLSQISEAIAVADCNPKQAVPELSKVDTIPRLTTPGPSVSKYPSDLFGCSDLSSSYSKVYTVLKSIRKSRSRLFHSKIPQPSSQRDDSPELRMDVARNTVGAGILPDKTPASVKFSKSYRVRRTLGPAIRDYAIKSQIVTSTTHTSKRIKFPSTGMQSEHDSVSTREVGSLRLQGMDLPSLQDETESNHSPPADSTGDTSWTELLRTQLSSWESKKRNQNKLLPRATSESHSSPSATPVSNGISPFAINGRSDLHKAIQESNRAGVTRASSPSRIPIRAGEDALSLAKKYNPNTPDTGKPDNADNHTPVSTPPQDKVRSVTPLAAHLEDFSAGVTRVFRSPLESGNSIPRRRVSRSITPLSEDRHLANDNQSLVSIANRSSSVRKRDEIKRLCPDSSPSEPPRTLALQNMFTQAR